VVGMGFGKSYVPQRRPSHEASIHYQPGAEEFAAPREQFALIVDRLQSAAVLGMEHGEWKD
jgi:hypothetical protein